MFMVHVVAGVVIAVVARVGVVRVRRVVGVRVGRVGQRRVVAVPCARAVRGARAVLAVVAAVHGPGPTRGTGPPAHAQAATDILAWPRTATSPHSYAQQPYHYSNKLDKFMTINQKGVYKQTNYNN